MNYEESAGYIWQCYIKYIKHLSSGVHSFLKDVEWVGIWIDTTYYITTTNCDHFSKEVLCYEIKQGHVSYVGRLREGLSVEDFKIENFRVNGY